MYAWPYANSLNRILFQLMDSHLRICIFDEGEAAGAIVSCLFIVIPATPSLT